MPELHAKHGPSALGHKEVCPGWLSSTEESDASAEGTMLHAAAEAHGNGAPNWDAGLTDDQRHLVAMARGYAGTVEAGAVEVLRETRLDVAGVTWGTADVLAISQDRTKAELIDYKFGRGAVPDAEENLQGWAYAVGAFHGWPTLTQVRVAFVCPRRDEISRHTFFREQMAGMLDAVRTVVRRCEEYDATQDPAMLHPDPGNCAWCSRKPDCPALGRVAAALAVRAKPGAMTLPTELVPARMDDTQLATAFAARRVLAAWFKDWDAQVAAEAMARTRAGRQIGDLVLQRKAGRASVTDPIVAANMLTERFGLTREEVAGVLSLAIGEAETAAAAHAPRGQGAAVKREVRAALEGAGLLATAPDVEFLQAPR